jgi:bifunctional non-homologous end joining protein LigD
MLSGTSVAALLKSPMHAEHRKSLPAGDEWLLDPSFPGDRVLAVKEGAGVRLHAIAHGKDVTNRFPVVAALVARLPADTLVLEATLCAIEPWQQDAFVPSQSLTAPPFGSANMRMIATDLLWVDDMDIRQSALLDRKLRLRHVIAGTSALEPIPLPAATTDSLAIARRFGAEAVIAKRRNSRYRPFARSGDWIRVSVDAFTSSETEPGTAPTLELSRL